ncbi:MAG TPA: hypothetical protein VGC58_01780 [Candidatus Paceibacterota bacterium]
MKGERGRRGWSLRRKKKQEEKKARGELRAKLTIDRLVENIKNGAYAFVVDPPTAWFVKVQLVDEKKTCYWSLKEIRLLGRST